MELVIDRLTKQFQNKIAVDRVSLRLHSGVFGLLGTNGAGKTTPYAYALWHPATYKRYYHF